ncbi:uncharacterized protein LY79DRAFT_571513 [Colletotrichum navitas]|uniref:Uncharacterized protein n=1 Tax=Colletotrichum navitas TaxID=681940 RepID=A0AAD8PM09_9PEZI|nr:uncharacterized protein LY79DRAFT_571513 [Colletotrichum navitas]KAK1569633.1 hypothetical protein LY79DRAFT_571513 [Colletotrichum navitas]
MTTNNAVTRHLMSYFHSCGFLSRVDGPPDPSLYKIHPRFLHPLKMVKQYIATPDSSTAPPKLRLIRLGSILSNVSEHMPLNKGQVIDVAQQLPTDRKRGFEESRDDLLGHHISVLGSGHNI